MLIKEALRHGTKTLLAAKAENPQLDSMLLLAYVLGVSKERLYASLEQPVSPHSLQEYENVLRRRKNAEPLQYILKKREFMSLDLMVAPGVLIPRPETEVLVEAAIELLNARNEAELLVADVGTGSGAIAVSLCKTMKTERRIRVLASDNCEKALFVARQNAAHHLVEDSITFLHGDLLDPFSEFRNRIHAILSNPPYIPSQMIPGLPPEVREHEPLGALDGGPDGLGFYRRIAQAAPGYLVPGGMLMFEVGRQQSQEVLSILKSNGFCGCRTTTDLAGIDRVVWGYFEKRSAASEQ